MLRSLAIYLCAAAGEIGGCYCVWLWLRQGRSWGWSVGGLLLLATFAMLLTRVDSEFAGRAYAAYGGVYISCSLVWLWAVEHHRPDRWDLAGALLCLAGAAVILFGRRQS
jgi:small multidrug resistance family-3 protein